MATGNTGNISAHLLHVDGEHPGKERAADDVGERQMGQNGRGTLRRCTGALGRSVWTAAPLMALSAQQASVWVQQGG